MWLVPRSARLNFVGVEPEGWKCNVKNLECTSWLAGWQPWLPAPARLPWLPALAGQFRSLFRGRVVRAYVPKQSPPPAALLFLCDSRIGPVDTNGRKGWRGDASCVLIGRLTCRHSSPPTTIWGTLKGQEVTSRRDNRRRWDSPNMIHLTRHSSFVLVSLMLILLTRCTL